MASIRVGPGSCYTYAQLEGAWIASGGPATVAPIAAAIGLAESGGCSNAVNTKDSNGAGSFGAWQINNGTGYSPIGPNYGGPPGWNNLLNNAQMAVAKYNGASKTFRPWGTFTSGKYQKFLQGGVTPSGVGINNQLGGASPNQNAQLTGFSLNPASWITSLFGSQTFKDGLQRVGLVLLGGALIIVGIFMLTGKQAISLVIPESRGGAAGGPVGSTTRRSEIHHYKHTVSDDSDDDSEPATLREQQVSDARNNDTSGRTIE